MRNRLPERFFHPGREHQFVTRFFTRSRARVYRVAPALIIRFEQERLRFTLVGSVFWPQTKVVAQLVSGPSGLLYMVEAVVRWSLVSGGVLPGFSCNRVKIAEPGLVLDSTKSVR